MIKSNIYIVVDRVDNREFYPLFAQDDSEIIQIFARGVEPNSVFWNSSDDFAISCIGYVEGLDVVASAPRFVATLGEVLKAKKEYFSSISKVKEDEDEND